MEHALIFDVPDSGGQESEHLYERRSDVTARERRERRKVDDEWGNRWRRQRRECLRAKPARRIVACVTGLGPKIDVLARLTTALGGVGQLW